MNLKKFISGISALTIAASAFAGLAVTASASYNTTTTYDFSTSENPPAWTTNRITPTVVTADDTETTTLSGDKGILTFTTANNASNAYSYAKFDYSSLIADASSYVISYKLYMRGDTALRGAVGIASSSDRNTTNCPNGSKDNSVYTTGMVAPIGRFSSEVYLRVGASNGNRTFLANGNTGENNQWITVETTVNPGAKTYSSKITGTSTHTASGSFTNAPDILEVYAMKPTSSEVVNIDDLSITVTKPSTYSVTFSATDAEDSSVLNPTVTVYSDENLTNAVDATALTEGTKYYYKAVLATYTDVTGDFTLPATTNATDTYAVPAFTMSHQAAGAVTVHYTDGTNSIAADTYPSVAGKYADSTVYWGIPKYIVKNGAIYYAANDVNSYYKSTVLTADTQDFTYTYAAKGTKGYFYETDDRSVYGAAGNIDDHKEYYSGGSGTRNNSTNLNKPVYITIPETGKYNVEINLGTHNSKSNDSANATAYVGASKYTGGETNGYTALDSYNGKSNGCAYGKLLTASNVTLAAGQILTVYADTDKVGADYILLEKVPQNVTVDPEVTNGTVEPDVTTAVSGDTVKLTVTPADGYELDTLTVTDANNSPVAVNNNQFTMPATAVTVSATFKAKVVEPSVLIADFESQPITYKGAAYTAAKLLVEIVGSVSAINVTYNNNQDTKANVSITNMPHFSDGYVVLGAIVAGTVNVTDSTFSVTVAE